MPDHEPLSRALNRATILGKLTDIRRLLREGASIGSSYDQYMLLFGAKKKPEIIAALLKAGATTAHIQQRSTPYGIATLNIFQSCALDCKREPDESAYQETLKLLVKYDHEGLFRTDPAPGESAYDRLPPHIQAKFDEKPLMAGLVTRFTSIFQSNTGGGAGAVATDEPETDEVELSSVTVSVVSPKG